MTTLVHADGTELLIYRCHGQLNRICITNLSCNYFSQLCSTKGKIPPAVFRHIRQNRHSQGKIDNKRMYIVNHNTLSDSFRIRIAWFQPKQDSDRIRISFFKNRTGSDSKKPYPIISRANTTGSHTLQWLLIMENSLRSWDEWRASHGKSNKKKKRWRDKEEKVSTYRSPMKHDTYVIGSGWTIDINWQDSSKRTERAIQRLWGRKVM